MDSNTKRSPSELLKEAKPYDYDDPELQQFDGGNPYRMLVTIEKKLKDGKYKK